AACYPDDRANGAIKANAFRFGAAALVLLAAFAWRESHRLNPLVRRELLRRRPFGGSMLTNLLTGGALMVVLVDVPILARGVYSQDTWHSGLLLTRFLFGVPIGALIGGCSAPRPGPSP